LFLLPLFSGIRASLSVLSILEKFEMNSVGISLMIELYISLSLFFSSEVPAFASFNFSIIPSTSNCYDPSPGASSSIDKSCFDFFYFYII